METAAEAEQGYIAKDGAEEGDAKGQAVAVFACGQGQGGVVQQVHKVGVGAEAAVGAYGVGVDFGAGKGAGEGGGEDHVHLGEDVIALALAFGQLVDACKGLAGGGLYAFGNDGFDHWQHGAGRHTLGGQLALGDPGALVEQAGGG